jgi:hypothetical protein
MNTDNNDIPEDIDDAIRRLRSGHDPTIAERAFLCGYLIAMQQARDMVQELELEEMLPPGLSQ